MIYLKVVLYVAGFVLLGYLTHCLSYFWLKARILRGRKWGLNICCGKTDGGGVNADIHQHKDVPNFRLIDDIHHLPFADKEFDTVLCSHTMEHVDNPEAFFRELERVGREVTVVVPPLYDVFAVFDLLEHKHIFLTFKKAHKKLPRHVRLPLARLVQKKIGQLNHA
jgi:SAM-dependent methyltransferase